MAKIFAYKLVALGGVDNSDGGVVSNVGNLVTAGRESNVVNPAT